MNNSNVGQDLPTIIQGGMGFRISGWPLARAVSMHGGLGTVSGVALERVLGIELQDGDLGGHIRRALSHFPAQFSSVSDEVIRTFYRDGSKTNGDKRRGVPVFSVVPSQLLIATTICANFVYVWLAKEGHDHPVSINYLDKIMMPTPYAVLGAMMASVDYITVGAGIPKQIPGLIDAIAKGEILRYRIPIEGTGGKHHEISFDSEAFFRDKLPPMKKPCFLPIVSSNALATALKQKLLPEGSIYGFVVEEPTAGGHNAPPRGDLTVTAEGEPIYGPKDIVDYGKLTKLGLPFWIGGSKASPEMLKWARSVGAAGIQVGTAFALAEESGMDPALRRLVRKLAFRGELRVFTDQSVSPAYYSFKKALVPGTLSDKAVYDKEKRACRHGALVTLYEKVDGTIGYRCPGEPVDTYVNKKGGKVEDTVGRVCLCNGLMATAGLGTDEDVPIVTLGDDVVRLMSILMKHEDDSYDVSQVFKYILS